MREMRVYIWLEHERTRLRKRQKRLVNEMSAVKGVQGEKEKTYHPTNPLFHLSVFLTLILALYQHSHTSSVTAFTLSALPSSASSQR
jgi:hypothetical protein